MPQTGRTSSEGSGTGEHGLGTSGGVTAEATPWESEAEPDGGSGVSHPVQTLPLREPGEKPAQPGTRVWRPATAGPRHLRAQAPGVQTGSCPEGDDVTSPFSGHPAAQVRGTDGLQPPRCPPVLTLVRGKVHLGGWSQGTRGKRALVAVISAARSQNPVIRENGANWVLNNDLGSMGVSSLFCFL